VVNEKEEEEEGAQRKKGDAEGMLAKVQTPAESGSRFSRRRSRFWRRQVQDNPQSPPQPPPQPTPSTLPLPGVQQQVKISQSQLATRFTIENDC